jgi:hypothetical protein
MSRVEKTSEEARDAGPYPRAEGIATPEGSALADIEVPPMIRKAVERHRADLAELLKRHAYQWAAYHGDQRLEIAKSKHWLFRKYLDRGLSLDELLVLGIGPPIPDVIEGEQASDV